MQGSSPPEFATVVMEFTSPPIEMNESVCVLSSAHPAGDVRIFEKECRSLARAGYHVALIVPSDRDEIREGVQIRAVSKPANRLERATSTVLSVFRRAKEEDAAIYHFHDPELIPLGIYLRLQGKKVIYDIHEDLPKDILSKHYIPKVLRWPLSVVVDFLESLSSRRFSALVCATPAIGSRFQTKNQTVVVVNNYPPLKSQRGDIGLPWIERRPAIGYVGGISEQRGLRQLVEAMDALPSGLGGRLKLAGEFAPPSFRGVLNRSKGWSKVDYLGVLSREAVDRLLGELLAGVLVTLPEPNFVRGQGHKMFEYMSAGIPIIASDFPCWRKIIEEAGCGFLVDPRDSRAIAKAIEFILTNRNTAEEMGRKGRAAVESKYNWGSEELKLLELYNRLLGHPCAA